MPRTLARFFRRIRSSGFNKAKAPESHPQAPEIPPKALGTPPKTTILLLPDELTLIILSYLDDGDTTCLALTCKDLKNTYLKPQIHPKNLLPYEEPFCDGRIRPFPHLYREARFWDLWYIYSERWNLLQRLARDARMLYTPCCACLMLHREEPKRRAPNSKTEQQLSKAPPRCQVRSFAEYFTTYAAVIAVIADINTLDYPHSTSGYRNGTSYSCSGSWYRYRFCRTARIRREKRTFRAQLERVWTYAPYKADEAGYWWWYEPWDWCWDLR